MNTSGSRETDPLQNLFPDIEKIVKFIEVKDMVQARAYETTESATQAEIWIHAKMGDDDYLTYCPYWDGAMFQEINHSLKPQQIQAMIKDPYTIPLAYHENLLKRGRERFLEQYEEKNDYYRMLAGLPPYGTPSRDYVYLSEPMRNQLHTSNKPIHMLSDLIQNSFMATDEYKQLLIDHPDKTYLKFLGRYKIDTFAARKAYDFEIVRYPDDHADINPNLLTKFATLYADYREYVMTTLYNEDFEGIYENYRNFMGLVIMTHTMLQICNSAVESVTDRNFLDDSILYLILSMYDIPSTLILTTQTRRDLAISMLKLTREKGLDEVYYDLIKILGYQDIIISKLMLMKGQKFENGNVVSEDGAVINSLDEAEKNAKFEPYFIQLGLDDETPYRTITSGAAPIHSYKKIIDGDPTWWDLQDTRDALMKKMYSTSNSKYIMVEANIQQMKYMFESVYFMRMILDNRNATDQIDLEIPEIFGTQRISIYDLMVYLLAVTCMNNGLTGEIISEESQLLATAGFNFDMDLDSFEEYLDSCKYVDKERVRSFLDDLVLDGETDIPRLFNDVMYPLREWLERKIASAENRYEYVEYESIYRAMFTYDINRNSFLDDFEMPIQTIMRTTGVTKEEMQMYQHFYPHSMSGTAITVDSYEQSRYKSPFLSRDRLVDWYIHIVVDTPYGPDDRGYVYFYDILNCKDCRELTNPDGTRVFMDYQDGEVGWEINKQAATAALEMIRRLDDQTMLRAFIQVNTPVLNSGGVSYSAGTLLPANIRTGLYKDILLQKLQMDLAGLAEPPKTYLEYLYRKNPTLYDLAVKDDRFHRDHDAWLNDALTITLAIETKLNMHLKYFEQSVVGSEMFFKPLITLMKRFKSRLVDFAKTGMRFVFGDKIDSGGNSNMFKLFDDVKFIVHFVTLASRGYESQFGLYDAMHSTTHHIAMKDQTQVLRMTEGEGFTAKERVERMGAMYLYDEMIFFRNGEPLDPGSSDPSHWIPGEPDTGRWSEDDDILMQIREGSTRVKSAPVDLDGWKEFVPSAIQKE
ncbi:MAG: hypothetical protein NC131_10005 [Roseburia sp.]|nr:hypothetical protein [Roseburia sp.]